MMTASTMLSTTTPEAAQTVSPSSALPHEDQASGGMEPPPVISQTWLDALQQADGRHAAPGTQLAHDAYDLAAWNTTCAAYPRLHQAVASVRQQCPSAPALLQDLFWSFLKAAPTFSSLAPSALDRIHRDLLSEVFQTREWAELRATGTSGDPLMSAMGAIALTERVLATFDDATKERLATLYEAEQQMRQLLQQAQVLHDASLEGELAQAEQFAVLAEQRRREAEHLAQATAPVLAQVQTATQAQAGALRHATRQALRETLTTQSGLQQTMQTFGGLVSDGALDGSQAQIQEKVTLAGHLQRSHKLQQIAQLCGQMVPFAHTVQQTKTQETPIDLDGVTRGRDLSQLLPGELALWDDPATEMLFLKGFAEGRLWQYERSAQRLEGQGPIIVALDSSGSMSDTLDGTTKEAWSKAVALSLLSIAREQQRDIAVLHFSSGVTRYHFVRGQATLEELTTCSLHFENGGTNFEAWMREALRLVDSATFDRADVICISDGLADISDQMEAEWNQRRKQRGMRVFGILLEEDEEMQKVGAEVLTRVADVWLPLATLADQNQIAEVFAI